MSSRAVPGRDATILEKPPPCGPNTIFARKNMVMTCASAPTYHESPNAVEFKVAYLKIAVPSQARGPLLPVQ
eukprot:1203658-Ditylum_brightwellii.AAC.1